MRHVTARGRTAIFLGRRGENEAEVVQFNVEGWDELYGNGSFQLLHKRSADTNPYPCSIEVENDTVNWTITNSDLAYLGYGEAQLIYIVNGAIAHSVIYTTYVEKSLAEGGNVPEPWESWVEEVLQAGSDAVDAKEAIENLGVLAETLVPGSSATVTKYVDPETGVVTLTFGIPEGLKGDRGNGITSITFASDGTLTISENDGNTTTYLGIKEALSGIAQIENAVELAESRRVSAEQARVSAENDRALAESGRVSAENSRASAEGTRQSNEGTRQSNESGRVSAESDRATAESNRALAETGRATAEGNRASAEGERVTAESNRAIAESGRATAEGNRATAESGRVTAEGNRVTAEQQRADAEAARSAKWANLEEAVGAAEAFSLVSEGFAVGKQDGTDVVEGSPYWHNNALYYSGEAAASATAAEEAQAAAEAAQEAVESEVEDVKTYTLGLYPQKELTDQSIASFTDGADDIPIKELVAHIEPVQDLHGQDAPYPAGGGKQMLNPSGFGEFPYTLNGVTASENNDGTFSLSGTATAQTNIEIFTYKFLSEIGFEANVSYTLSGYCNSMCYVIFGVHGSGQDYNDRQGSGATMTFTSEMISSLKYRLLIHFDSGVNADGLKIKPMICKTSEQNPTTFAPYSNICPIFGHTECEVRRTGKNLYDRTPQEGNDVINRLLKVGKTYTVSAKKKDNNLTAYYYVWKSLRPDMEEATRIGYVIAGPTVYSGVTFTVEEGYYYSLWGGSNADNVTDVQLELGSSATAYEPYLGTTYDIDFPVAAGTVYGGTLTVNQDGTGTLLVDRANIASYDGETLPGEWISSIDAYAPGTTPTTGAQVVYYLASALTYTLTAEQVGVITTLLGENNVWHSCNGNLDITYRADLAKYITKDSIQNYIKFSGMIAGVETGLTASKPYNSGEYFIVGQKLYQATASIASGATFTVGTNCTETTVGAELVTLNS